MAVLYGCAAGSFWVLGGDSSVVVVFMKPPGDQGAQAAALRKGSRISRSRKKNDAYLVADW